MEFINGKLLLSIPPLNHLLSLVKQYIIIGLAQFSFFIFAPFYMLDVNQVNTLQIHLQFLLCRNLFCFHCHHPHGSQLLSFRSGLPTPISPKVPHSHFLLKTRLKLYITASHPLPKVLNILTNPLWLPIQAPMLSLVPQPQTYHLSPQSYLYYSISSDPPFKLFLAGP